MECFQVLRPCVFDTEHVLAFSVYNEGIAMAVRRGAPLASYSIDRKCLNQYMHHLTNADTNASVCCVCARRCLHVRGGKNNEIELRPLLTYEIDRSTLQMSLFF